MRQIKMNKLFIYLPVTGIYLHPPQSQIIWKNQLNYGVILSI